MYQDYWESPHIDTPSCSTTTLQRRDGKKSCKNWSETAHNTTSYLKQTPFIYISQPRLPYVPQAILPPLSHLPKTLHPTPETTNPTLQPFTMTPLAATDALSHLWDLNSNKPTIVFVPSFFHTAAHYGPLSRHLQAQSYDNFALRLPSISDRAGTASACMSDDVATVRRLLEALVKEEEEDVVLVMHSYGAVPGCQAVTGFEKSLRDKDGKGGGVVSLVVVCGLLVEEGESIESTLLAIGEKGLPEYAKVEVRTQHLSTAFKL